MINGAKADCRAERGEQVSTLACLVIRAVIANDQRLGWKSLDRAIYIALPSVIHGVGLMNILLFF